jgi:hypothetical protein
MKAHLLFRDRDFDLPRELRDRDGRGTALPGDGDLDPAQALPWNAAALTQDLELDALFQAMAHGDRYLFEVAKKVILSGLRNDPDTILYRQAILKDCLKNPAVVRGIYDLAVETITRERKDFWGLTSRYPDFILHRSVDAMQLFVGMLRWLRQTAEQNAATFESEGFSTLFDMLKEELRDEYFASIEDHLKRLQFRGGVLISAGLGAGNKGTNYVLRKLNDPKGSWLERAFAPKPPSYRFEIAERDENGAKALGALRDRGINLAANSVAQSNDHILSFFNLLRVELAFYVGCLNLAARLNDLGEPTCFPQPAAPGAPRQAFRGLYDVCLALVRGQKVVGNDLEADGKKLLIVTGANQGGKSTFLRSLGLAQLMMQCGMYAPAETLSADICDGLFTHFKREEDATMKSGKLDEELNRMNEIVAHLTPHPLLLFNESFAATNEREGSEIARQIVSALLENGIKVAFVTHQYTFAHGFYSQGTADGLFLKAERRADGERTFRMIAGEPTQTSYGEDLYHKIFRNGFAD